jgi:Uma2 family endonuclease
MLNPSIALWRSIVNNPVFHDMPYKVETTRSGGILMSPASNWHGYVKAEAGFALRAGRHGGEVISGCSITTIEGVKVADVAWASDAFMAEHGYKTPYLVAPEICVEVRSPGNSVHEIESKITLYLAKGAVEVWVVEDAGTVSFHDRSGPLKRSKLVKRVTITKHA